MMYHSQSLYTIPAAYTLAMIPHTYALVLMGKRFDVRHPRKMLSKIDQDQTLDAATKARIHRAEAATANNIESIGLFAAAVVAGNYSGLPTNTLNTLSVGYVISRIVYNFIYVNNNTELKGKSIILPDGPGDSRLE